jgi:hypothetical protein
MYPGKQNPEVEMPTKHARLQPQILPKKTTNKIKTPHPVSNLGLQNLRGKFMGSSRIKISLYTHHASFQVPTHQLHEVHLSYEA